ncbi:hypothetical protein WKI68_09460 [Streptomyces sp. MS1.HAVA.3]|uniref:Uncharacterized protein n=1 Tax=Streptomyces caledonius TaxID=3134107 RepID=A0ABU8U343_9ACTN
MTVQSRQYLALPEEVLDALFDDAGAYSEMWPVGPDSVDGRPPRNIRIAHIEDRLLDLANRKSSIRLVPKRFDVAEEQNRVTQEHVLVVAEGGRSAPGSTTPTGSARPTPRSTPSTASTSRTSCWGCASSRSCRTR